MTKANLISKLIRLRGEVLGSNTKDPEVLAALSAIEQIAESLSTGKMLPQHLQAKAPRKLQ